MSTDTSLSAGDNPYGAGLPCVPAPIPESPPAVALPECPACSPYPLPSWQAAAEAAGHADLAGAIGALTSVLSGLDGHLADLIAQAQAATRGCCDQCAGHLQTVMDMASKAMIRPGSVLYQQLQQIVMAADQAAAQVILAAGAQAQESPPAPVVPGGPAPVSAGGPAQPAPPPQVETARVQSAVEVAIGMLEQYGIVLPQQIVPMVQLVVAAVLSMLPGLCVPSAAGMGTAAPAPGTAPASPLAAPGAAPDGASEVTVQTVPNPGASDFAAAVEES